MPAGVGLDLGASLIDGPEFYQPHCFIHHQNLDKQGLQFLQKSLPETGNSDMVRVCVRADIPEDNGIIRMEKTPRALVVKPHRHQHGRMKRLGTAP